MIKFKVKYFEKDGSINKYITEAPNREILIDAHNMFYPGFKIKTISELNTKCKPYDVNSLYPEVVEGMNDPINHPNHYTKGIETLDYINSWEMSFMQGNVIKYVTRYPYKNGLEDLKKAQTYLTRLIDLEENK